MTGACVAGDIRMRVMPPVVAFNDGVFREILGTFDDIDERAEQRADDLAIERMRRLKDAYLNRLLTDPHHQ